MKMKMKGRWKFELLRLGYGRLPTAVLGRVGARVRTESFSP